MNKTEWARTKYNSEVGGTMLLLFAALIWGSAFTAQRIGAGYVGTFTFMAGRCWLSFLFLLMLAAARRQGGKRRALRRFAGSAPRRDESGAGASEETLQQDAGGNRTGTEYRRLLIRAGILSGIFLFAASSAQQAGIAYTTTAKSGFITSLYVVFVPILAVFAGRRPRRKIWLCIALAVVGLWLLTMTGAASFSFGDSITLLCALLFAFQIIVLHRYAPFLNPVDLTCVEFLVSALLSTVFMFALEHPEASAVGRAMPSLLYAGILSGGIGYTLQTVGERRLDPAIASLSMCMESVFSALTGWIILHQSMTPREMAGAALMFCSIVLAQL